MCREKTPDRFNKIIIVQALNYLHEILVFKNQGLKIKLE